MSHPKFTVTSGVRNYGKTIATEAAIREYLRKHPRASVARFTGDDVRIEKYVECEVVRPAELPVPSITERTKQIIAKLESDDYEHRRYMRPENGKVYLRGTYTPEELRAMADWVEGRTT